MNHPDRAPGVTLVTDRPTAPTAADVATDLSRLTREELVDIIEAQGATIDELQGRIDMLNALEDGSLL